MENSIETDNKTEKRLCDINKKRSQVNVAEDHTDSKSSHAKLKKRGFKINLKHSLCSIFKSHKMSLSSENEGSSTEHSGIQVSRCLPPIPFLSESNNNLETQEVPVNDIGTQCEITADNESTTCSLTTNVASNLDVDRASRNDKITDNYAYNDEEKNKYVDFAANFEKIKDCGWYWGPISSDQAERFLWSEPNGSFLVRDSSDNHHIFSLTVKLADCIRHVRIEHSQGCFSFGSYVVFKNQTIVDFIENAMKHSRSGRYLFFLHRRPAYGPMRVQLLYPVSRFKKVQSLQHLCRFIILKTVRRDMISLLPLPRPLLDYLHQPQYFLE